MVVSAPEIRLDLDPHTVHIGTVHSGVRLMTVCQARNCVTGSSQGETDSGSAWPAI